MLHRTVVGVATLVVVIPLVAGCAGARSAGSQVGGAAPAPAGDLSGTWHGTFGQIAASLYADESVSMLRINPDGTFTATVGPGGGTNNLAKRSAWSGTVVTSGDRVTLRNEQGPWPWIILTRSGDDVLFGLATDPAIQAPVMIKFNRMRE